MKQKEGMGLFLCYFLKNKTELSLPCSFILHHHGDVNNKKTEKSILFSLKHKYSYYNNNK